MALRLARPGVPENKTPTAAGAAAGAQSSSREALTREYNATLFPAKEAERDAQAPLLTAYVAQGSIYAVDEHFRVVFLHRLSRREMSA